jgi:4-hydroxy-tetrahydrodipicolinate synthase
LVYPHLALGGDGMLCIGVNLAPKTYVALYDAFRSGDMARAVALQDAVSPIVDICLTGTFPAAVKACLSAQGIPAGPPFLPVTPVTDAQTSTAVELLGRMQAASRDLQAV